MSHTPLDEPTEPVADDAIDVGRGAAVSMPDTAWVRFRPILVRLHFYAGLFVGPFILVAAVTGLMYALIPQIDSVMTRGERTVEAVGERTLPVTEQLAAVRAAHPEGTVQSIRPPAHPDETTQVTLAVDDVPPDYARTVFVDPYTGDVHGALTTYGQWMPTRAWFDELHRNLHLGAVGRNYSELAASWLGVVALAGLALWIGHRRGTGKLRRVMMPDRDATGRRRLLSWHGAIGAWVVIGLLGLSVTGMTWSRFAGESIDTIQSQLASKPPAVDTSLAAAGVPIEPAGIPESEALAGADIALGGARGAGLTDPLWMYPPAKADEGWLISENKRTWPTRFDAVSVDPRSGQITDRVNLADWPPLAKLTNWAIDAHMGILFGIVNQILLAMVAVGLIVSVFLGYRMWWRRRPTQGGLPRGPRRNALAGLRPAEAVLVVIGLAALGWFAPLFGVSLAAFVVVDVAIGWWKARTAARIGAE